MSKLKKILVANRGEIALRVMRTAKELGLKTVAVHSTADSSAPFVTFADEAYCIGAGPVGESYLRGDAILQVAQSCGADCIHPGYGFLSENAGFAKACAAAGITFIGPSAEAIDLMGNKAAAKRRMLQAGVPCVPGYEGENQADDVLIAEAAKIGAPIMVKAAAGGGGRGMRLVHDLAALPQAIQSARSEALNAFGSDELILEKAVLRPRHVEVQVFADTHGNTIHLGERDCSVQRRHQKVVEEAPCPIMTEGLRAQMGAAAVEAARAVGYVGAGTVEFLLDDSGAFYFLEMNTRLQVEHPVTEMITGLDLVALQINVAAGSALGLTQQDVTLSGHAIEVRLYAENPADDFLPATGHVDLFAPAAGPGLRFDAGVETGSDVSPFYDPMIAKVIAWGETRDMALSRLKRGLVQTRLYGLPSNKGFLVDVLSKATFAEGAATTAFIAEEFGEGGVDAPMLNAEAAAMAAVLLYEHEKAKAKAQSLGVNAELADWSSQGAPHVPFKIAEGETELAVGLSVLGRGAFAARIGERQINLYLENLCGGAARFHLDGRVDVGFYMPAPGHIVLDLGGHVRPMRNVLALAGAAEEEAGGGRVVAPMHGTLLALFVAAGDRVEKGTRLGVLEAMKMQHDLLAEISGTVVLIAAEAGKQIAADDLVLEIEPDETEEK